MRMGLFKYVILSTKNEDPHLKRKKEKKNSPFSFPHDVGIFYWESIKLELASKNSESLGVIGKVVVMGSSRGNSLS